MTFSYHRWSQYLVLLSAKIYRKPYYFDTFSLHAPLSSPICQSYHLYETQVFLFIFHQLLAELGQGSDRGQKEQHEVLTKNISIRLKTWMVVESVTVEYCRLQFLGVQEWIIFPQSVKVWELWLSFSKKRKERI